MPTRMLIPTRIKTKTLKRIRTLRIPRTAKIKMLKIRIIRITKKPSITIITRMAEIIINRPLILILG